MYSHVIKVTIDDDVVHRYTIMEWEVIFLRTSAIREDDLPLSYGRIAEVLAEEYHRYGNQYFQYEYGTTNHGDVKEETDTTYTDRNGFTISTRIPPAVCHPDDPTMNSMQMGVASLNPKYTTA